MRLDRADVTCWIAAALQTGVLHIHDRTRRPTPPPTPPRMTRFLGRQRNRYLPDLRVSEALGEQSAGRKGTDSEWTTDFPWVSV
jgi:hypothetical protein